MVFSAVHNALLYILTMGTLFLRVSPRNDPCMLCWLRDRVQITYLIVADVLVVTVVTILQLMQHIVSLKSGAFIAHCRIVEVSKSRFSMFPTRPSRVPFKLDDLTTEDDNDDADAGKSRGTLGRLARWAGWSACLVGRNVKC